MISFNEAYQLTLQAIQPLGVESVPLLDAVGRIAGQDLSSLLYVPSVEVSYKDGYALHSADIRAASPEHPVRLRLVGSVGAGGAWKRVPPLSPHFRPEGKGSNSPPSTILPGETVRILSGAPLPPGADAILAEEFARAEAGAVFALAHAEPGRNILPIGADVQLGQPLVQSGQRLAPTAIGLLAAAGYPEVPVICCPRVAILATGDEVVAPGQPLGEGKLYASNLVTLAAWCRRYGFDVQTFVAPDDAELIRQALQTCLEQYDAVLTSGGAWKGERDLTARILEALGWQKIYHRVRIGPGKAVGFGLFQGKPVFILPGGPPSNHMAFLQLALPGLHRLAGYAHPGLPEMPVVLATAISGQVDWTQFIHGKLEVAEDRLRFIPLRFQSRLVEIAHTDALAQVPEGMAEIPAGSEISVQLLDIKCCMMQLPASHNT